MWKTWRTLTDDGPPLTNAEWDRLFAHERAQRRELEQTVDELRAELVAAHEELAALKRGAYTEQPFA